MKVILIVAPGRLELAESRSRLLLAQEVRIAVAATCVCGSDLKNISKPVLVPQVLGHEFSGMVVEVSAEARLAFRLGVRVTAFPIIACLKCQDCQAGRFRDCVHKLSLGFQLPGCFAEEIVMDYRFVVPLAEGLSYEQGALVEHLCCGYRLAMEMLGHQTSMDAHVLIIGDGPIALADLQTLRLCGYRNITLVGKHALRMEIARKLGASRVLDMHEINAVIKEAKLPLVDVSIMAAPAEETLGHLLSWLRPRGLVFPQTRITSTQILSHCDEREIVFGRAFAYEIEDFAKVMGLIVEGKLKTEFLVTNRINLLKFVSEYPNITCKAHGIKTMIVNHRFNEIVESYRRCAL